MTTREKICATICGICMLLALGSVGAIDCGDVSITQGFIQAVVFLVGAIVSVEIAGFRD